MKRRAMLRLLPLALLSACGGATTAAGHDAAADDTSVSGDAAARPVIQVYVTGDLTPKTFTDGFSGVTPTAYTLGLSRFDLMRSATDPAPVAVLDRGADWVEVDMLSTTLLGETETANVPADTFTHARVLLTMARCTVPATAHQGALSVAGSFTITGAFRDTTIDGQPLAKGQARFTFTGPGVPAQTQTGALPPLPSTVGGSVVSDATGTWLVFTFPQPLAIDPTSPDTHVATAILDEFESFRWQDQATAGYTAGVFDLSATGAEPVESFGATGYRIEAQ